MLSRRCNLKTKNQRVFQTNSVKLFQILNINHFHNYSDKIGQNDDKKNFFTTFAFYTRLKLIEI